MAFCYKGDIHLLKFILNIVSLVVLIDLHYYLYVQKTTLTCEHFFWFFFSSLSFLSLRFATVLQPVTRFIQMIHYIIVLPLHSIFFFSCVERASTEKKQRCLKHAFAYSSVLMKHFPFTCPGYLLSVDAGTHSLAL